MCRAIFVVVIACSPVGFEGVAILVFPEQHNAGFAAIQYISHCGAILFIIFQFFHAHKGFIPKFTCLTVWIESATYHIVFFGESHGLVGVGHLQTINIFSGKNGVCLPMGTSNDCAKVRYGRGDKGRDRTDGCLWGSGRGAF